MDSMSYPVLIVCNNTFRNDTELYCVPREKIEPWIKQLFIQMDPDGDDRTWGTRVSDFYPDYMSIIPQNIITQLDTDDTIYNLLCILLDSWFDDYGIQDTQNPDIITKGVYVFCLRDY